MLKSKNTISHEQNDGGECQPCNPEGDGDHDVNVPPVGRDRRQPPRGQQMKRYRADSYQDKSNRYWHCRPILASATSGRHLVTGAARTGIQVNVTPRSCDIDAKKRDRVWAERLSDPRTQE